MKGASGSSSLPAFDLWGRLGVTEHLGGVKATRRVIALCKIRPGQSVLVVGCGTGHTACLLAKEYGARVVALDISPEVLRWAKKRVAKEGVRDRVTIVEADAHKLPFAANSFDAAIAESVLIFCDQAQAASEARRVLKREGVFGVNEMTYLKPPPERLHAMLAGEILGVRVRPLLEDQWRKVFRDAGFAHVSSSVHRFSLWEQFSSHLQIDGLRRYVLSTIESIADPQVRAFFVNFDVIRAAFRYPFCMYPGDP